MASCKWRYSTPILESWGYAYPSPFPKITPMYTYDGVRRVVTSETRPDTSAKQLLYSYTCDFLIRHFSPSTQFARFHSSWKTFDCVTFIVVRRLSLVLKCIGKESVPIQLAQCWFPGLTISDAKICIYRSNKIYGSNFIKQHSETVMV